MKLKERVILIAFLGCSILILYKFQVLRKSTVVDDLNDFQNSNQKRNVDGNKIDNANLNENKDDSLHGVHPWDIWWSMVDERHVTSPQNSAGVTKILKAMSSALIVKADVGPKGTQLKALLELDGPSRQKVVFKPMRYSRDHIINGKIYDGFDRHNAEIAAFHLDRILGFYRAPPVVGRRINLNKEFKPVAKKRILKTFFTNDKKDICFYGVCFYCKKSESACADGEIMEGSLTIWLPEYWPLSKHRHPWQRTYNSRKARWEIDKNYCKEIMSIPPYNFLGPRMLDIIDTSIFDFLIGNGDRHHYETFRRGGSHGMLLHLDNGKSFGNPEQDEISILSPIIQCCKIRESTYTRIKKIATDSNSPQSLSLKLQESLKSDPIFPILSGPHLLALDRRLGIILKELSKCIDVNGEDNVVIKDKF